MKVRFTFNGQTYTSEEYESIRITTDEDGDYLFTVENVCDCTEECEDCDASGCGCVPDEEGDVNCWCSIPVDECYDDHEMTGTPYDVTAGRCAESYIPWGRLQSIDFIR